MRKCTYFKWVKNPTDGGSPMIRERLGRGSFHAFGVDFVELENGAGSFSTCIIQPQGAECLLNVSVELVEFN